MVSTRLALVLVVLASDLLLTGLVFGWAPLLLLLQEEQQYVELCGDDESSCVAQENKLNLMFAVASVAMNAGALPIGVFLDYLGPRMATAAAALVEISGIVLLALADSQTFDVFVPAYLLIAFGGCITMMASFPASFLIMQYQTAILAAISCLFDGSSVVFLVLYTIHERFGATRQQLFLGLAIVAAAIYILLIVLWGVNERHLHDKVAMIGDRETEADCSLDDVIVPTVRGVSPLSSSKKAGSSTEALLANTLSNAGESYGTVHAEAKTLPSTGSHLESQVLLPGETSNEAFSLVDVAMTRQMRSFEFAYILIFAAVQVLRATIYIGTANKLLENYGDAEYGFMYTKIFSVVLPVGFVFVPAIDHLVETRGLALALLFTTVLGSLYSLLTLVPSLPLQCLTVFVFTAFRAFLYAVMSAFTAKTFGLTNLGSLMGVIFSISSIVSLVEYPAVYLSNAYFDGDLTYLNVLSLVMCLALLPLTECLRKYEHRRERGGRVLARHTGAVDANGRQVYSMLLDTPGHGLTYLRSPGVTASAGNQLKFAQP
jgi:LAT3 family solute carrier family 43 protein 3